MATTRTGLRVVERDISCCCRGSGASRYPRIQSRSRPYFHFDLVGFNAGQFNADSKAGSALENVDRRTPLNARIMKIGEMDFGDLVGNLANLALEKSQAKSTGFSAHDPQWTRWANEATGKSSGVARSSLLYRYASPHPDTQPGTVFAA